MKLHLATVETFELPRAANLPHMGTYTVDGDCPAWQRKMRAWHGAPIAVTRTLVGSSTGRLRCFESDCTGVH